MWAIYLNGEALHIPGTNAAVTAPKLKQAANSADSLQFTIASSHPLYQDCIDGVLTGRYIVEKDGVEMSRGRILSRTINPFDSTADVVCEGELAYLNDSVLQQYDYSGTPRGLLKQMLDEHNAQCDVENRILLGNVTVRDANNYIVRGSESPVNLMTELLAKTVNSSTGGWFNLRHDAVNTYLDWLETPTASGNQSIAKGSNLLDISDELDGADLITALLPLGKNNDGYIRLSGNDGRYSGNVYKSGDFLYLKPLVDAYGWHADVKIWEDVTTVQALRTKAIAEVKSLVFNSRIEISAIDLSDAGYDVDSFTVGQSVALQCDSLSGYMTITSANIELEDPAATTFGFNERKNSSDMNSDTTKDDNAGWSTGIEEFIWVDKYKQIDEQDKVETTKYTLNISAVPKSDIKYDCYYLGNIRSRTDPERVQTSTTDKKPGTPIIEIESYVDKDLDSSSGKRIFGSGPSRLNIYMPCSSVWDSEIQLNNHFIDDAYNTAMVFHADPEEGTTYSIDFVHGYKDGNRIHFEVAAKLMDDSSGVYPGIDFGYPEGSMYPFWLDSDKPEINGSVTVNGKYYSTVFCALGIGGVRAWSSSYRFKKGDYIHCKFDYETDWYEPEPVDLNENVYTQPLALASASRAYNDEYTPKYSVYRKVVNLYGAVKPAATVAAGGTLAIGTLPEKYRPQARINQLCQGSGGSVWLLEITTAGAVSASRYRNGTENVDIETWMWLPFAVTFITQ